MPTDQHTRNRASRRFGAGLLRVAVLVAAVFVLASCSFLGPQPVILSTVGVPIGMPQPTCGGLKILIEGALPCQDLASIAIETLGRQAPDHLARGVVAIDVSLAPCPSAAVDQNVDCLGNEIAQFVMVTFGPMLPDSPVEPSLVVVLDPVSGQLLGFENPHIR